MKFTPIFLKCVSTFAVGCSDKKKCTETFVPEVKVSINEAERSLLNYNTHDKLVFYRQPQNDTLIFIGQLGYDDYYPVSDYGVDNCSSHKYLFEMRSFHYHCVGAVEGISDIIIEQNIPLDLPTLGKSYLIIKVDYGSYRENSELMLTNNASDSIVFGNKTYRNLFVFGKNNNQQDVPQDNRCYINKEDGIVRIVAPFGETYTLIEKK